MDIEAKKIWQVAAGDTNRNYADLCLKWDVILNGPGSEGPWPDCVEAFEQQGLSLEQRAENLTVGDFAQLTKRLCQCRAQTP